MKTYRYPKATIQKVMQRMIAGKQLADLQEAHFADFDNDGDMVLITPTETQSGRDFDARFRAACAEIGVSTP